MTPELDPKALERMRDAARALPSVELAPDRRAALRERLIESGRAAMTKRPPRRSRRAMWLALGALAAVSSAAAAVAISVQPEPASTHVEPMKAKLFPSPGAELVHLDSEHDEIVRLRSGSVTVEIGPLASDQRFRVMTADAEVEAAGATFDVASAGDRLETVRVLRGQVTVRPANAAARTIAAGEVWSRPAPVPERPVPVPVPERPVPVPVPERPVPVPEPERPVPVPEPAPAHPRPAPARPRTSTPAPAPTPTPTPTATPDELAFQAGWSALRSGDAARAATELARVSSASPLHEDASFWRAIALTRTTQTSAATQALSAFLTRYPRSAHAGSASVSLGWIDLARGAHAAARAELSHALHDPDPAVRASAERGLARLPPD